MNSFKKNVKRRRDKCKINLKRKNLKNLTFKL